MPSIWLHDQNRDFSFSEGLLSFKSAFIRSTRRVPTFPCFRRSPDQNWKANNSKAHVIGKRYKIFLSQTYIPVIRKCYHLCFHETTSVLVLFWKLTRQRCNYTFMGRYACHIDEQFPAGDSSYHTRPRSAHSRTSARLRARVQSSN